MLPTVSNGLTWVPLAMFAVRIRISGIVVFLGI